MIIKPDDKNCIRPVAVTSSALIQILPDLWVEVSKDGVHIIYLHFALTFADRSSRFTYASLPLSEKVTLEHLRNTDKYFIAWARVKYYIYRRIFDLRVDQSAPIVKDMRKLSSFDWENSYAGRLPYGGINWKGDWINTMRNDLDIVMGMKLRPEHINDNEPKPEAPTALEQFDELLRKKGYRI